jgi:hypothetical protein
MIFTFEVSDNIHAMLVRWLDSDSNLMKRAFPNGEIKNVRIFETVEEALTNCLNNDISIKSKQAPPDDEIAELEAQKAEIQAQIDAKMKPDVKPVPDPTKPAPNNPNLSKKGK